MAYWGNDRKAYIVQHLIADFEVLGLEKVFERLLLLTA